MSKKHLFTRRDFLRGSAEGMTMFAMPALLQGLLEREARAAGGSNWTAKCALLHVHASGGWGYQGTFVAKDSAGRPIPTSLLKAHGQSSTALTRLFTACGAEMYLDSGFTAGFLESLTEEARSSVQITSVLNTSPDDNTSSAKYGVIPAATFAGAQALLSGCAGLENTVSGNGTFSAVENPKAQRLFARTVGDIINAGSFSKVLGASTPRVLQALADGLKRVSTAQLKMALGGDPAEELFRSIQGENYEELSGKVTPPAGSSPDIMNPADTNSPARTIFGLTAKTAAGIQGSTNGTELQAALILNSLNGNIGPAALRLNGFDYHGQADTATFARDKSLGQIVGRACELAFRMGKTLLVFVTTDGGLSSNMAFPFDTAVPGTSTVSRWQGDRRAMCGAALFAVNGPPAKKTALGHVNAVTGQVVESTAVGVDYMATAAVIVNWLALNDRMDDADRVLVAAGLSPQQIIAAKSQIIF